MNQDTERRKYIPVSTRKVTKKLFLDDIVCIEREYNEIVIRTLDGVITVRRGTLDVKSYIGECEDFYQCHSYLLINMRNVASMEDGLIVFTDGEKKKIGKRNYYKAKTAFASYISR